MEKTTCKLIFSATLMGAPAIAGTDVADFTRYSGFKPGSSLCASTVNLTVYENDG
jgi:hypothetical protein